MADKSPKRRQIPMPCAAFGIQIRLLSSIKRSRHRSNGNLLDNAPYLAAVPPEVAGAASA